MSDNPDMLRFKATSPYNLSLYVRPDFIHFAGIHINLKMNFLILNLGDKVLILEEKILIISL